MIVDGDRYAESLRTCFVETGPKTQFNIRLFLLITQTALVGLRA
jgi:hypothetical protein